MPARNIDHDAVIASLMADGWTITDDPLTLDAFGRNVHIDLGAERSPIGAERDGERIAVEVQSFRGASDVRSLQEATGQFLMYRYLLADQQPDRRLYLSVDRRVYDGILSEPLGQLMLRQCGIPVLVFDAERREVVRWIA